MHSTTPNIKHLDKVSVESMEVAHHIGMMLEGPDAGLRRVA